MCLVAWWLLSLKWEASHWFSSLNAAKDDGKDVWACPSSLKLGLCSNDVAKENYLQQPSLHLPWLADWYSGRASSCLAPRARWEPASISGCKCSITKWFKGAKKKMQKRWQVSHWMFDWPCYCQTLPVSFWTAVTVPLFSGLCFQCTLIIACCCSKFP